MSQNLTPTETLIEAVGEDTAITVLLWLSDIYDTHVLEFDGKHISPSVEWLRDSLQYSLMDETKI